MTDHLPTYVVTGATGGIGAEIVKALATKSKCRIIMAVRRTAAAMQLAEQLADTKCTFTAVELDLSSEASVRHAAEEISKTPGGIDALINNAGIMPGEIKITPDGHELATEVNYINTKLFTELLLPYINDGGAITFTTSMTRRITRCRKDWAEHARTYHGIARRFFTYGRSKRMIAAFARQLAKEVTTRDIRVNCSDPGIADTGMLTMGNRVVDALANALFRPLVNTAAQGATAAIRAMQAPDSGNIYTHSGMRENKIE